MTRQLIAIGLSLVAFVATLKIPLGQWQSGANRLLIAAGVTTALALIMPVNPNYPAHRWVQLGGSVVSVCGTLKFAVVVGWLAFWQVAVNQGWIKDLKRVARRIAVLLGVTGGVVVLFRVTLAPAWLCWPMAVMMTVAGVPMRRLF